MSTMSDDELQGALLALAPVIEFPRSPDLSARVGTQIRQEEPAPARRRIEFRLGFAYALAVVLISAAGLLVFSPTAREAVADFIGVGGERIEFSGKPPAGIAKDLDLGERVSAEEAAERADFDLRTPELLGTPDEIYVTHDAVTTFVSMVWPANDELPEATSTGVGALLTQFRSSLETDFIKKLTVEDVTVTQVTVDSVVGYWVEGPHTFMLLDSAERPREDTARLAGNTLIWERSGITYRLEGDFDRATAVRIADTLP